MTAPAKRDKLVAHSTAMESIQCTSDPVDIPSELPSGGIPARNHKVDWATLIGRGQYRLCSDWLDHDVG